MPITINPRSCRANYHLKIRSKKKKQHSPPTPQRPIPTPIPTPIPSTAPLQNHTVSLLSSDENLPPPLPPTHQHTNHTHPPKRQKPKSLQMPLGKKKRGEGGGGGKGTCWCSAPRCVQYVELLWKHAKTAAHTLGDLRLAGGALPADQPVCARAPVRRVVCMRPSF